MRRIFLGNAARLVFTAAFAESAAPDVLREALCGVGERLGITPEQAFTFTGSSNVKGPGRHHCRQRWRLLMTEGPVYLSRSTHHREGGQALPCVWV